MGTQFDTFDGARFAFNDRGCKYIVMQPAPHNIDHRAKISVHIQSNMENLVNPNDNSAYINLPKIISINYNGSEIVLKASSAGLGDSPTNVMIDGTDHTIKLPYFDAVKNIEIRKVKSMFTVCKLGNFFQLYFDGSKSAYIIGSNAFKNNVSKKIIKNISKFIY